MVVLGGGLGAGSLYRAPHRSEDQWPPSGADDAGCCGCCFEWDTGREFDQRDVEAVISGLVDRKSAISYKQGQLLMENLRQIGHMQRDAALELRRASALDAISFVSAGLVPLLTTSLLHTGLSGGLCNDGSSGDTSFLLLGLVVIGLSIASLVTRAIARVRGSRPRARAALLVVEEMKAEANQFIIGLGPYAKQRAAFPQLLLRLEAVSSNLQAKHAGNSSGSGDNVGAALQQAARLAAHRTAAAVRHLRHDRRREPSSLPHAREVVTFSDRL